MSRAERHANARIQQWLLHLTGHTRHIPGPKPPAKPDTKPAARRVV